MLLEKSRGAKFSPVGCVWMCAQGTQMHKFTLCFQLLRDLGWVPSPCFSSSPAIAAKFGGLAMSWESCIMASAPSLFSQTCSPSSLGVPSRTGGPICLLRNGAGGIIAPDTPQEGDVEVFSQAGPHGADTCLGHRGQI